MPSFPQPFLIAALSLCALGALAGPSLAHSSKHLELQDMVKGADIAFRGQVVAMVEEAVSDKHMAFTHVTFVVSEVLLNRTGMPINSGITLTFAGGEVDGQIVKVSGVPEFTVSEEVVIFARHDGKRYASPVLGIGQGLFRIVRDSANGRAFPVRDGGAGIEAVNKGSLVTTDRVASITNGVVTYRAPEAPNAPQGVRAPSPSGAVTGTQSARVSNLTLRRRPSRLVDVSELFEAVRVLERQLPHNRRR